MYLYNMIKYAFYVLKIDLHIGNLLGNLTNLSIDYLCQRGQRRYTRNLLFFIIL